jgi:ABC-type amino acid transport substrate-binding protein
MTVPTDALIEPGVLLIGVDEAPPAPLNFGLPGSPDFYGFEVDLTAAIGARMDLAVRYRSALWSTILNELAARRLDMDCGAALWPHCSSCLPLLALSLGQYKADITLDRKYADAASPH